MNVTRRTRVADPLTDGALSLLWPGLGQLHQGRTRAGLYFIMESATLVAAWLLAPTWGVLLAGAFVVVAICAIADAVAVARKVTAATGQPAS